MTHKRTPESLEPARQARMRPVLQFTLYGRLLNVYESVAQAVKMNEIGERTLYTCLKKRSGIRRAKGFVWGYLSDYSTEQVDMFIRESKR